MIQNRKQSAQFAFAISGVEPPRRIIGRWYPKLGSQFAMRHAVACTIALLALSFAGAGSAQVYPHRPVRLVVPFPPGGGLDLMARTLAGQMQAQTGQNIVVDNRAGANGIIGSEIVARASADGYTVMLNGAALILGELLYRKLPYEIERDFMPVTSMGRGTGYLLLVNASTPLRSVKDLIAFAREKERVISYGSAGVGNPNHLASALFSLRAGISAAHVAYKGTAPSVTALMTGEVHFICSPASAVSAQIKAGRLRALAFTGTSRLPSQPDLPTIAEAGVPGYGFNGGFGGLFAPAKTPAAVIAVLRNETYRALQNPQVREFVEAAGYVPGGESPDEFRAYVRAELEKYREAVKAANLELQ